MNKKAFAGLFLLIALGAAGFRLADPGRRPVHHDEANQALKFGALLEKGEYRYDRTDHHGPSLYYLTLPFARICGQSSLAELDERTLRLVPASFGIGTILLLLLFVPMIGRKAVLWCTLGLAVSPVMVYFSRFYIQETLLLFFLAAAAASLWRYFLKPSWAWAAATGLFCGMMYATKETAVIAFGSIAAALLLTRLTMGPGEKEAVQKRKAGIGKKERLAEEQGSGSDRRPGKLPSGFRWAHLVLGLGCTLLVSLLLFTSFFQNPRGFFDSLISFRVYFVRAGEGGFHVQPWHYYLKMLAFSKTGAGPVWSEAFILLLALAGGVAAFRREPPADGYVFFRKFILFFTLFSTAVYSLIPYKTPWNILPFYIGFILLAGCGAAVLLDSCRKNFCWAIVSVLLAAGFLHLGLQARRSSFTEPAEPRNPYVYAQTSPDLLKLVHRVEDLAALHPDGDGMLIKVVAGPYETWPLPWYLRRFSRVGYWTDAAAAGGPGEAAVVVTNTEQAGRLESLLNESFLSEYYGLRPNVFLVLHIRSGLWEEFLKSRAGRN
ncbi:MAG: flippase activity-associated protein Agl23 [Candidatus Aminicenantales bacterium]